MAFIKGTNRNDHLTSGAGADRLKALKGNDLLVASGDDTLDGGLGNDTYRVFDGGAYRIIDAGGIDTIETDETEVHLADSIENLMIHQEEWFLSTATGNDLANIITVFGDGASRIDGGRGRDTLKGGDGSDTINGGAAPDNVHGGAGQDYLFIDGADWHVDGDEGNDVLVVTPKYFDLTRMPASRIEEMEVIDLSQSATGNVLTVDRVSLQRLSFTTDTVEVILGKGDSVDIEGWYRDDGVQRDGAQRYILGKGVQLRVYGSAIEGTSGDDVLTGNEWANVIEGLAGDDTLTGGLGVDTLRGGSGDDVYVVDDPGSDEGGWEDDVIIDSGGTDTLISMRQAITLAAGIEHLVISSSGETIRATGNDLANLIINDSRNVRLDGADGDDTLVGGAGSDDFNFRAGSGSYGNDVVDGGGGTGDWIVTGWKSAVVVDFHDGTVTGGGTSGSGSVRFTNIEGAAGGSFDDLLIADDQGRMLFGHTGDDTLIGGAGNDSLMADSHPHFGTPPEAPRPNGADSVIGGGGDDRIYTDGGADTLGGGAGNDTLNGGIGADILHGDAGADALHWEAADVHADGGAGEDRLVLTTSLDLTAVANDRITDIEVIELASGFGPTKLTLASSDILDLSSSTDTLKVLGTNKASVDIVGAFVDEGVHDGFHRYRVGTATLLVDTDITNVS